MGAPSIEAMGPAANLTREHGFEPLRVEGTLPSELAGTLYRQGPGLFELFGTAYQHVFEADGAVSAVRLRDGEAWGASRLVQSEGLLEERRRGKALYSFAAPWWRRYWSNHKQNKNTANTNVIAWQGRIFGLMEACKPTEISPEDLSTLGETDLGEVILGGFSAHPHDNPKRKALYNFGLEYDRVTNLHLYELPYKGSARRIKSFPLPFPPMLHDFMVTENYLLFFLSPAKLQIFRGLFSIGPWNKLFQWDPNASTEVFVIPIDRPDEMIRFSTEPFYQWHFSNAYEHGNDIVVDYVRYPDFSTFGALGDGSKFGKGRGKARWGAFHRARLNLQTRSMDSQLVWDGACEFPRVHPDKLTQEYRYVWLSTEPLKEEVGKVPHSLLRIDVKSGDVVTHDLDGNEYPSEPVFVPKDGATEEDEGYILSLVYEPDSHTSYLGVYDGQDINAGALAKVWFDHHIPVTFHGNWVPAT